LPVGASAATQESSIAARVADMRENGRNGAEKPGKKVQFADEGKVKGKAKEGL